MYEITQDDVNEESEESEEIDNDKTTQNNQTKSDFDRLVEDLKNLKKSKSPKKSLTSVKYNPVKIKEEEVIEEYKEEETEKEKDQRYVKKKVHYSQSKHIDKQNSHKKRDLNQSFKTSRYNSRDNKFHDYYSEESSEQDDNSYDKDRMHKKKRKKRSKGRIAMPLVELKGEHFDNTTVEERSIKDRPPFMTSFDEEQTKKASEHIQKQNELLYQIYDKNPIYRFYMNVKSLIGQKLNITDPNPYLTIVQGSIFESRTPSGTAPITTTNFSIIEEIDKLNKKTDTKSNIATKQREEQELKYLSQPVILGILGISEDILTSVDVCIDNINLRRTNQKLEKMTFDMLIGNDETRMKFAQMVASHYKTNNYKNLRGFPSEKILKAIDDEFYNMANYLGSYVIKNNRKNTLYKTTNLLPTYQSIFDD
jgi:hypothetical protein